MTTLTTDPPFAPSAPRRRHTTLWWLVTVGLVLLAASLIGAATIPLPYYAIKPGSVTKTNELILVDHPTPKAPKGSVSFVTVNIRQTTALQAFLGWADGDIDVVPEKVLLGDRNAKQNVEFNQQLMDTSKSLATEVALEYLGYHITTTGSLVVGIAKGYPADGELVAGDTIVAVDGHPINDPHALTNLLGSRKPGDEVALTVDPPTSDVNEEHHIKLAPAPNNPSRGVLGVSIQDRDPKPPFSVTIDSGRIGGPSAGLAFTLGLIDRLTDGDLTGGLKVACTGTINPDGSVGPVGGGAQKTAAVREAGMQVFLVPSQEYALAKTKAGKDLKVIKVDTLEQALQALRDLGGDPVNRQPAGGGA